VQADSFDKDPSNVLSAATTEERHGWLRRRSEAWSQRYGGGWNRVRKLIDASMTAREREARAKWDEAQQRLQTKWLRRALVLAIVLLSVAGYFAWSAWRDRGVANVAQGNAEHSAQELQKSLEETNRKRQIAEASLATIQNELAGLREASQSVGLNNPIRQTLDQVESSIAQQVTTLTAATRVTPRIYIHIAEESQRPAASELERRIESGRFNGGSVIVPGIQLVDSPPPFTLLRCFAADECRQFGQPLLDMVSGQLVTPKITLQDFSKTYTPTSKPLRPQHFELYFTRGPITLVQTAK
jgi:hypothetical protein